MNEADLEKIIRRYTTYLQAEKMITPGTVRLYAEAVNHFIQHCSRHEDELALPSQWGLENLGVREIESFLHSALQSRSKHETLVTQLSGIRGFFKFLHESGQLRKNPVQHYTLPRGFQEMQRMSLNHDAIEEYFSRIPQEGLGWRRNRLLLELSYGMGLTTRQLAGITNITPDSGGKTVTIRDVKGESNTSPIGYHTIAALKNYLSECEKQGFTHAEDCAGFWLDDAGMVMNANKIHRQIANTLRAIGLGELKQGTLRELSSQHFADDGADIRSVQNLRNVKGLKRIKSLYRRDFDELQNAFQQSHQRHAKSDACQNKLTTETTEK